MSFFADLPLICIILALLCSVVTSALKGRAARSVCLGLAAAVVVMQALILSYMLSRGEAVTFMMGHYPAPWGNEIRFGILEPLLSLIFSLVLLLSVFGGKRELLEDIEDTKLNIYYSMVDLVQTALLVLVYTNDIFTGYVFIEICTIASCGLLMIRQVGRTTLAATRYMIFSLLGSGLFLLGVILLYGITGQLLMPEAKDAVARLWATGEYHTPLVVVICVMTIGLSIKSGLFPFHFWMPDTYGYSTPSSSAILSGLVSKGYLLLFIRMIFCVFGTDVFYASGADNVVFILGVCGMVVGSVSAIHENDINRMTAYSSAAQIGYIFMGIGISPTVGVTAAVFHIITHAITKPALFLASSKLARVSGGSKRFADLQGSAHRNTVAGLTFTVGAFSMVGLPLFAGFVSKYLFATAALQASPFKMYAALIVLAVSTILNTVYFLRTVIRIYTPTEDKSRVPVRTQLPYALSSIVFIAMNLFAGLGSSLLIGLLERGLELL